MKKIIFLVLMVIIPLSSFSQEDIKKFDYKAIFEFGFNKGINGNLNRIEGTYIHAFHLTSNMTAGVGVSLDYDYEFESLAIPIFFDIRSSMLDKKYSPTIGFKVGYSVNDVEGFYMNPALGYKFNKIHFSIGYIYYYSKIYNFNVASEGISFKVGFSL